MEKILQITAGKGPAECTWVVAQVLKIMLTEAKNEGLEAAVLHKEEGTENGTIETVFVSIKGKNTDGFINSWKGTVQWIGQSQFRKLHKRKNWFIGVFEIEKSKNQTINETDIQYQAMRSSGAGGQHVNKVSSAIRATHVPTGIMVVAMDSRSQHQNKKIATERLIEKINQAQTATLKNELKNQWQNQTEVQRGNPTRTFTGSNFKKETTKNPIKKDRQQAKNELKNF
jgi:peptide chain release factor